MAIKARDVIRKKGKPSGKKEGKGDALIAWIGSRRKGAKAAMGKSKKHQEREEDEDEE